MGIHRVRVRTSAVVVLLVALAVAAPPGNAAAAPPTATPTTAIPTTATRTAAAPAARPEPGTEVEVGAGTHFLDHEAKLAGLPDPAWYEANIPFVDLPDRAVEDTYYYRWRTFKEALKYTGPQDGWIVTEFLGPVGYAAPGGAISAAAGHHLYEGRWLRDQRYLDDYLDYWLTGPGASAKPATEGLGKNTTDWAHQYSFWVADAALAKAEIDGRVSKATARLGALERQWRRWSPQYDAKLGLYWQTPVWDAMEFTASSYQSDDPYHGGDGYRPTLNAYQYGDAKAIATLARLAHRPRVARTYDAAAARLQKAQEKYLWDAEDGFYKHVMRDDNPGLSKIADREEIGFVPWYFHMAPAAHAAAWDQLLDPQGFAAPYGPTTVERRSPWFMHDALQGCCRWDGPSWPYATSQTLTALGNQLIDYPAQDHVTAKDFADLLHGYALTQRKDGRPYVAEAHHPDEDRWIYDAANHSEDYNHSTFDDLVLSTLFGVRGQTGPRVRIAPQLDPSWDHAAVENVPYHGHNLSVVWDEDGSHYGAGRGLSVYVDGRLRHRQGTLRPVTVPVPPVAAGQRQPVTEADDAANPGGTGYPRASASYSWRTDAPSEADDGQEFQLDVPSTRWTTYQTPNAQDWLAVDFGVRTRVDDVRVTFYDDGGGVRLPTAYDVQYRRPDGSWSSLPGQQRSPATPVAGTPNRVVPAHAVQTDAIRVVGTNRPGSGFGITSLGSWRPTDDHLRARILGTDGDAVTAAPGTTATVRTQVAVARGRSTVATDELRASAGWQVERIGRRPRHVRPGTTYAARWRVHVPADFSPSTEGVLRYVVTSTRPGLTAAGDTAPVQWTFDPATFGRTTWDDDFSTDRLADYRLTGVLGEPAPTARVDTTSGTLDVTSTTRARGLFRVPAPAGRSTAVVVTPRSFAASKAEEDSLFVGTAAGPSDFAMSWYNHTRGQSGANVVVGGAGRGEAEGPGADVTWVPGDRLATVLVDGTLTSWVEHDGRWRRLATAPVDRAVPPTTLATWSPAFSTRSDTGTLRLDRVTVLSGR